jgi:hypothetical protein
MNRILTTLLSASLLPIGFSTSASAVTLAGLPKYQTPLPQPGIRIWHLTQNLGPTGARGWFYINKRRTVESREILIKSVEPHSPADGKLEQYDVIIGTYDLPESAPHTWEQKPKVTHFKSDARFALARAITWAETKDGGGKLKLLCVRNGKEIAVTVDIPVIGSYSGKHPLDCPKHKAVAKNAAEYLANNMPVNGYTKGAGESLNALFLLGHDDPKYMDHARRSAMRIMSNDDEPFDERSSWHMGPTNIFLSEYYLATGDERVLPTIKKYADTIAAGQCAPGTWGHRMVPNFIPPGYGSLNAAGIPCFTALVLSEQCGVTGNSKAIENSINFYGAYAGVGAIPYGDHPSGYDATSGGKNGMAAVAFNTLDADRISQWFAQLSISTDSYNFESGHSGNFYNQTWTPLGASLTGKENYTAFWNKHNIYRDLARRHDGSFITQPQPHGREGDLGSINYVPRGPKWSTGAFALSYIAGNDRLALTGRKRSVFAVDAPDVFTSALADYKNKNFKAAAEKSEKLKSSDDPIVKELADQLIFICKKNAASIKLTLSDMESSLKAGDLYKVKMQLNAIRSIVADSDSRLSPFKKAISTPEAVEILKTGKQYHEHSLTTTFHGDKGYRYITYPGTPTHWKIRNAFRDVMKLKGNPYAKIAADRKSSIPPLEQEAKHELIKKNDKAHQWKKLPKNAAAGKGWAALKYNDSKWINTPTPLAKSKDKHILRKTFEIKDTEKVERLVLDQKTGGNMKVYLNGTLILDHAPLNGRSKYSERAIPLKAITKDLLQNGKNVIAVDLDFSTSSKALDFDLGLRAAITK